MYAVPNKYFMHIKYLIYFHDCFYLQYFNIFTEFYIPVVIIY